LDQRSVLEFLGILDYFSMFWMQLWTIMEFFGYFGLFTRDSTQLPLRSVKLKAFSNEINPNPSCF
jgi:hypothetical protein